MNMIAPMMNNGQIYQPSQITIPNRLSLDRGLIEYIKQLIDPMMVLNSLGIPINQVRGKTARGTCPIHGGDNKSAFAVDLDAGRWRCYTHDCHHGYSDMIGLVQLARRCNFMEAVKFIAALMGIDLGKDFSSEVKTAMYKKDIIDFTRKQDRRQVKMDLSSVPNIEEEIFYWISDRSPYFYDKGYTHAIQDYFEIGFHYDRNGVPRATIPIRDADGRFVAVDGRRLDNDDEPRYFMQPFGFVKGLVLYHYHKAKEYLKIYNGDLFVVEGYKALWSMVQAGILNVVACMGAGLSAEQPQILMKDLNIKRLIFALDGDTAGKNGSRRSVREIGSFTPCEIIDFEPKYIADPEDPSKVLEVPQDPSTLSVGELKHILSPYL